MIDWWVAAIALVLGATVGFLVGRAVASAGAAAQLARTQAELDAQRLREQEREVEQQRYVAQIRADQEALKQQFQALAAETLKSTSEQFFLQTEQHLARAQQAAAAETAKREQAVKQLVEPMKAALDEVKKQTTEADKARVASTTAMTEHVRQMVEASTKLDKKTSDFINTLRRSDVRGNWGEVQLKRVVELAGMLPHVDFTEQDVVRDSEGTNLRPDMTVRLAGGRSIVVDSKVALAGLLEAFETDDERVRAERLQAHARQFRKHIDDLAGKRYWEQFDSAPEFVVMFVPAEGPFQSALEQDDTLQEYAFSKRVVVATPTTLVALLRAVAHAWKEDALAKNAREVLSTGKELYDRLTTMGNHLARVGRAIDSASKAYNQTVASMESRVLVTARKFGELQQSPQELGALDPVETDVRRLSAPEFPVLSDSPEDGRL